jgi:N-carbamoyl-L-amino-acid hydrolase
MLTVLNISTERIEQHFSALSQIGNLGPQREDGYLRASWSTEESAAMAYIKQVGQRYGLQATYDGVGNLFLVTPENKPTVVQVGSHLDTVPKGGLFDGAAGIVAGLEAILALRDYWPSLRYGLELVVWRGEESATFGAVCKGSQAAFGQNPPDILTREFTGKTLEKVILSQGFEPGFIRDAKPTLSQERVDSIVAHLELHIEQAKKLETAQLDIGIATSIRGMVRLRVIVIGEAAHSGGTPLGTAYRKDANLAMAYMQVELDKLAAQVLSEGADLVQTVGVINCDQDFNLSHPQIYENALTKVSPFGYFTLDIRSNRQIFLSDYARQVYRLFNNAGRKFGVDIEIEKICSLPALESLDQTLQATIEVACRESGYGYVRMPSGSLHDIGVVSQQKQSNGSTIAGGLIFIPCRDGLSHNPKEYATPEAIRKGTLVLARTLQKIAV